MSTITEATSIRPFKVEIPEDELADLRRRIEATRWPSEELVADYITRKAAGFSCKWSRIRTSTIVK